MNSGYEVERSRALLKRSFLPRVQLKVRRQLLRRMAVEAMASVELPSPKALQHSPLFAPWPEASLAKLLGGSLLVFRRAGMTVAHRGEPRKTLALYWVVSGKLMQVPTKQEIVQCSHDCAVPSSGTERAAITGPLVFPTLFRGLATGRGAAQSAEHEAVLDRMIAYSAAQTIDGEALLLGDGRQRAVRCHTDAVLLEMPMHLVLSEVGGLKLQARLAVIKVARSWAVAAVEKNGSPPQIKSILERNRALEGMSELALKEVWRQLLPVVLYAGETVCDDVFVSTDVYFLGRGEVRIGAGSGAAAGWRAESRHGAGIGLNSFACQELPARFGERRPATAHTYCELWSTSLETLTAACDTGDNMRCARQSALLLSQRPLSSLLAVAASVGQVPAFASLSEFTVGAIVRSLRLKVHPPGKLIVVPSQTSPVKEGILVVCGACSLVRSSAARAGDRAYREEVTAVTPGTGILFCEALLARSVNVLVRAETCVVALHAGPGTMLDALEGLNELEMGTVIDAANEFVVATYGVKYRLCEETPQQRAAARVRGREAGERAAAAHSAKAAGSDAPVGASSAEVAATSASMTENRVLTSLELQLASLHHDTVAAKRQRFFRDAIGEATILPAPTYRDAGASERGGPAGGGAVGCFTLDERGELVFDASGGGGCGTRADATRGGEWSRQSADARTAAPAVAAPPTTQSPLHVPSPPPAPTPAPAGGQAGDARPIPRYPITRPKLSPSERSLHVPVTVSRSLSHGGGPTAPLRPPPRLTALKGNIERLRDEADGFDPRAERRRQMLKPRGTR